MNDKQEATQLKFLHCADIHLDIPYFGLTPEQSDERRRELRLRFIRADDLNPGDKIAGCKREHRENDTKQ